MFNLLKDTFREWREDGANRLAAALAYYTTFSLAPLLVLIIAIAGLAGGRDAAQTQTTAQVEALLGADGREFVQGMIESARWTRSFTVMLRSCRELSRSWWWQSGT